MTVDLTACFPTGLTFDWTSTAKEASLANISEGQIVGDAQQELLNGLFAETTAMLEDAIEIAIAGQSARLSESQLADHGSRLLTAARSIEVIADAIAVLAIGDS